VARSHCIPRPGDARDQRTPSESCRPCRVTPKDIRAVRDEERERNTGNRALQGVARSDRGCCQSHARVGVQNAGPLASTLLASSTITLETDLRSLVTLTLDDPASYLFQIWYTRNALSHFDELQYMRVDDLKTAQTSWREPTRRKRDRVIPWHSDDRVSRYTHRSK
jgi:hypothetical protein